MQYRLNKIEKLEGGSPESYEKVQMDEHEDEGESPVKTTPVKTERMKSNEYGDVEIL